MKKSLIFALICLVLIQLASAGVVGISKDTKNKLKNGVRTVIDFMKNRVELGAEEAKEVNGAASSKVKLEVKEVVDEGTDPMDEVPDLSMEGVKEAVDEGTDPIEGNPDKLKEEVKEIVDEATDLMVKIPDESKEEVKEVVDEGIDSGHEIPAELQEEVKIPNKIKVKFEVSIEKDTSANNKNPDELTKELKKAVDEARDEIQIALDDMNRRLGGTVRPGEMETVAIYDKKAEETVNNATEEMGETVVDATDAIAQIPTKMRIKFKASVDKNPSEFMKELKERVDDASVSIHKSLDEKIGLGKMYEKPTLLAMIQLKLE